jgi:TonB family protein
MRPQANTTGFLIVHLMAVGLCAFLCPATAVAGDVKVIANQSVRVDTISAEELKSIFLEEQRTLGDGTHVEPVLARQGPAHETFLKQYLNKTDDVLQTYYRSLVFTGRGSMPKALSSDAEVVAFVSRTRGAIGYVSSETQTDGVKILAVVTEGSRGERAVLIRVEPEYPETLQRLAIGGSVRLAVTVSPKGSIENVQLLGGNPVLAEAAISAVKQWVFAVSHSRTTSEIVLRFDPHR